LCLRNSNTCHDRSLRPRGFLRLLGSALALVCSIQIAAAIDPNRTTSQYVRERWATENGFPRGPVYSITQTPDGYLWVGAEMGLIRFDGLTFRDIRTDASKMPALSHVMGLMVDHGGALWTLLRRPTLLRYRDGEFTDMTRDFGPPNTTANALGRATDGAPLVWIQELPGAVVLRGGKFETLAAQRDFSTSPVLALAQTPNGDVWAGTRDTGLFRISPGRTSRITEGLPDLKVNALASAGGGELWVGTDNGVVRWDGSKLTAKGLPPSMHAVQALALLVDRDANLWVGTNGQGLARLNASGVSWMNERQASTNEAVTALFEDREGNLWTGSAGRLERIRDSAFVTYSQAEGMPSEMNGPLCADAEGRLWFAPIQGGLWWLREGKPERVTEAGLAGDIVYSIAGGKNGLWVGRQRGGLTLLHSSRGSTTYTTAQGLAQNSVYSVYESRNGSVWAGTLSGGVSRFKEGRFTTYTSDNGLASNTVTSIAEGSGGTMWFGTPKGLSSFMHDAWRTFGAADGLPSENINCMLADSRGVLWIGTANGLSFWKQGAIQTAAKAPASLREQILGIAEDRSGSLWISTSAHVLRVNGDKLMGGELADGDVREFTVADGLRGIEGVKRSRSVISDPSGRVWFSMNHGISVVDPGRLTSNSAPAIVHVQALSADGRAINLKGPIHLPGGSKRLTVEYAGLSLSVPERVRYRYMLEGFDSEWSSPVATREAVYTNLSPRRYRFRVVASNPDGVWNTQESVLGFVVDPLFWQTWWFQLAIILACGLAALLLYRLRLHQFTRRLNLRFEERLAERTRIAQELHDTLLQGFLSASMQVHVAADCLPEDARAKPILTRALQQMSQVIEEGRNTVRGLRSSKSASLDLEHAFSLVRQEFGPLVKDDAEFRVIVDGEQRHLHPLLRDEVYRIGREALLNAFRHSGAKHVEIELRYSSSQLRIFVRDDGSGIDPKTVEAGRDGHWGLSGMRERADRIGGQLHVFSRAAGGTEVELDVPGHLAFQHQSRRKWKWFGNHGRRTSEPADQNRKV
jgi:ligand-binding sensor domain-containing protein/signal transduction histidine kinase